MIVVISMHFTLRRGTFCVDFQFETENRDMIPCRSGSPERSMSVPPVFALRLEAYDYGTKYETTTVTNWPRVPTRQQHSYFGSIQMTSITF